MRDVVIVDSVRTGLAKSHRGSFNETRPDDLAAFCIDALLQRNAKLAPEEVDDVIIGCASQQGAQGGNMARFAVALTQLPLTVPATTISRACSSGLNSIAMAANQIASGYSEAIIAGGSESITYTRKMGASMADSVKQNQRILDEKPEMYMAMGETAEIVAQRYNVTRDAQDLMALQSQQRMAAAQEANLFADEIVPMTVKYAKLDKASGETSMVETTVTGDECNRSNTTLEGLNSLKPVFSDSGSVTAGNASQLSDGASMTLLMSAERAAQLGLEPLAYFRGFSVAGCEPDEMGIGPIFAIPKLLKCAGLNLNDIDLVELNEAFASQCVYSRDFLGIDPEIYNVNGGSIAIGHPFGMTGSRMTGHIVRELRRRKQKYGIISMCIGGGMGAAGLVEAC